MDNGFNFFVYKVAKTTDLTKGILKHSIYNHGDNNDRGGIWLSTPSLDQTMGVCSDTD